MTGFKRYGWRRGDLVRVTRDDATTQKFNPFHRADNGQFDFAPGGQASGEPKREHAYSPYVSSHWQDKVDSEKRDTGRYGQARIINAYAKLHGMSPDEYLRRVDEHLQRLADEARIYVQMTPADLGRVLRSGEIQPLIDSGHSRAGSYAAGGDARDEYLLVRAAFERNAWAEGDHPVYALATPADDPLAAWADRDERIHYGILDGYGEVSVELRRANIADRTTIFQGDSLDDSRLLEGGARKAPVPLNDVSHRMVEFPREVEMTGGEFRTERERRAARIFDPLEARRIDELSLHYIEAQVHGPVHATDIERVLFDREPPKTVQRQLKEIGATWSVRP